MEVELNLCEEHGDIWELLILDTLGEEIIVSRSETVENEVWENFDIAKGFWNFDFGEMIGIEDDDIYFKDGLLG